MGLRTGLLGTLLACMGVAAAPPPAWSEEELRELAALEADPAWRARAVAMEVALDDAVRTHARALAARGDAASLVDAALIWPVPATSAWNVPPPPEPAAWLQRARTLGAAEVDWLDILDCRAGQAGCDPAAALARAQAGRPDAFEVHAAALAIARREGRDEAVRAALARTATASSTEMMEMRLRRRTLDALARVPAPTLDPALLAVLSRAFRRPVDARWLLDQRRPVRWLALQGDGAHALAEACSARAVRTDPGREGDCRAALDRAARMPAVMVALQGLRGLVALESPAGGAATRARLRELEWLFETASPVLPVAGSGLDPRAHARLEAEQGEIEALRAVLRALDHPATPPDGWVPRRMRAATPR